MPKYLIWGYNPRNKSDHMPKDLYGNVFTYAEAIRIMNTLKYDGVRYNDYKIVNNYSGVVEETTEAIKPFGGPK